MGFKDMVEAANKRVFLDTDKFAELRTVIYGGVEYVDIPIILTALETKRRAGTTHENRRDNMQGLFMVSAVLRCALEDLGGKIPEKMQYIKINNREGGGGFFMEYMVASSTNEMGILRVELEAVDE